jgi:hypothetical protein
MKTTIKQTIQELINSGITQNEIIVKLEKEGVKKQTIKWYYNKLNPKQNETTK